MPVIPVIGAIIGTVGSAVAAVGTAVASTVGAVVSTVGSVLGTTAGITAAGSIATATISSIMQKKAQGKALKSQEAQALKQYELQNKAVALEEEKRAEEKVRADKEAEAKKRMEIATTRGREIETLSNLLTASKAIKNQPQPAVVFNTPAPVQPLGFFDRINTFIDNLFKG